MRYQGNKINPTRFSAGQIPFFVILIPLACVYMLPIAFIFVTAFKPLSELFAFPPRFYVIRPTLSNFRDLAAALSSSTVPLARYLFNSILSTLICVAASVLIALYAGFSLAKKRFRCKAAMSTVNTMAMMFVPVAEDSLAFGEYNYRGEMLVVCSRATSGFYDSEFIWKIMALLLIAVAILLLLWAIKSFRQPEKIGGIGLIASIANLAVTAFMVLALLSGAVQRVLIVVPILLALIAVVTLVLAIKQRRACL